MSAVSGLNAKAEKGRAKYVALDINSIYKGKSLETTKTTVQPKHGLQSLGKVSAGRRMPPPANLPSLRSESSGNNPSVSLVPSGGQGWGASADQQPPPPSTNTAQPPSQPPSSLSQQPPQPQQAPVPAAVATNKASTPSTPSTGVASSKTWSSVTSSQEAGGPERSFLGQQSPFFPQEFPKLAGGDAPTDQATHKTSADTQYGPGPSLRPQTEGSWGRGTLQQQPPPGSSGGGGPPPSSGSGVNGPQPTDSQRPPPFQQSAPPPPSQQFRGMMPSYMFGGRNAYPPGGYPSNYNSVPPPPQQNSRPQYSYPENRRSQPVRPLAEEEAYQRPAAIITEKALKGFDEILQNDTQDTWATSHAEIDYNAKLVFSDDEETPAKVKKDKREDEKPAKRELHGKGGAEKERERVSTDRPPRGDVSDWNKKAPSEQDSDWAFERRDNFDREERWKSWNSGQQPQQKRDGKREWQMSGPPPQRAPFDYRGPPPHARVPGPPLMQHGNFPPQPLPSQQQAPPPPPGGRSPRLAPTAAGPPPPPGPLPTRVPPDEEEAWRQRRRQHSAEMTATVERARQRRAQEEKHYEQSKANKVFEHKPQQEKTRETEKEVEAEDADRSRHSSESRDDKPRGPSQPSYQGYNFSRQFQKNVPPRFQKQAAEHMRQQQGGQPPFMRSQSGPYEGPPWPQHPYQTQAPNMGGKGMGRQRSNSQGSASDSYESDTPVPDHPYDREPKDGYWRERRPPPPTNTGSYDGWQPPPPQHQEGYFEAKHDPHMPANKGYEQRHEPLPPGNKGYEQRHDAPLPGNKGYEQRHEQPPPNKSYEQRHDPPPPANKGYEQRHETPLPSKGYEQRHETPQPSKGYDFKRGGPPEKEEKAFDAHREAMDRREKDFESQDYRYKGRDSFKESQRHSDSREPKEKGSKSNSWAREYDERNQLQEVFEEPREKAPKERHYERPEKEARWEKERPDGRDSRPSRESAKDDSRHIVERNEPPSPQIERERKGPHAREERKEKQATIDWGESPYPVEKRREWYHHPPPITPKQFESMGPPKKNLTTLSRRSNAPEKKPESSKDEASGKKGEQEPSGKKEKDAKEEKNEKIKSEVSSKDTEKGPENKYESIHKPYGKEGSKKSENDISEVSKKDTGDDKEKTKEHSGQGGRDRRRDRGGNARSRGVGGFPNNVTAPVSGGSGRYENVRGNRNSGGSSSRGGSYPPPNVQMGAPVPQGAGPFRGKREYRRSKVESRGPRFDRQKDKEKEDKKDDDTSCSDVDEGKVHLRQKDEDSEVSVDEASASTTESAQAEKYQEGGEEKGVSAKGGDKPKKEKKEAVRSEAKGYEKEDKGGFAPRGEPSRRGRGGGTISFRNSARGGSRHGPSSYGPPPSRAGFGASKPPQEKIEEQKIVEENYEEDAQNDSFKNSVSSVENVGDGFAGKSRNMDQQQQRRTGRFDHLPPRFQKNQQRQRFDGKFDQPPAPRGGRVRGSRGGYHLPAANQPLGKTAPGGKENSSDVGNEEWETASESSDVGRHDEDKRERGSRKSFSGQRPLNPEGLFPGRRTNDQRRSGPYQGGTDRNRQAFPRSREGGGRGRATNNNTANNNNSDRRLMNNNNGNGGVANSGNPRPTNSTGSHSGGMGRSRGGPGKPPGPFLPKGEGTAAVYRCEEIKLQDPASVQAALTDLTNRRNMKGEVGLVKVPKCDKDKSGGLEGYDLNNYASVVIIDDHPEVGDDNNLLLGADDGFQEVTSKKRHKVMVESEVKKMKKEPHARNKSGSRSRQSRLPPRFARQREGGAKSAAAPTAWDINVDLSPKPTTLIKDTASVPPANAWEKPITLRASSPSPASAVSSEGAKGGGGFDRSDQHDSGIDVSDQPASSAASSQRSSPSNDCKIVAPPAAKEMQDSAGTDIDACKPMCTVVFENKNFKAENAVLDKFGGQVKGQSIKEVSVPQHESLPQPVGTSIPKSKETTPDSNEDKKPHCISAPYSSKDSFTKNEDANNMKLDFTFDSGLSEEKSSRSSSSSHLPNKTLSMAPRSMDVSNGGSGGVGSPISPSADDLNLKIQSVKKVWENDPPLPTVMEHPQAVVSEESGCPSSYGSFSTNPDPSSNVYSNVVEVGVQARKENDQMSEMAFRESSKVEAKAPLSPPLVGGLDMRMMASSVHAIPSPPATTLLFNSSQQMAQTAGMYQPLPMDNRQTPNAAAVAAAMVQFSHSPQGYAPYGLTGGAYQQPWAQQGQDHLYSGNQFRVQPPGPYAQSQQMAPGNQVLGAQQNLANSHLLGSQLRAAGGSPASLSGLHGLQPQTSYFSSGPPQPPAAPAPSYFQPPTAPAPSPQYQNFPGQQSVMPQGGAYRSFTQFKAPGILPDRSATRSPTVDISVAGNRSIFGTNASGLSGGTSSAGKQQQQLGGGAAALPPASRMSAAKTQQQFQYYPFGGQQKFPAAAGVRTPQVLFQNVVQRTTGSAPGSLHYPPPIQRPPATAPATAQPLPPMPPQMATKLPIRPPMQVSTVQPQQMQQQPPQLTAAMVPGGKLSSAQQAKLRAEAVKHTHLFFTQAQPELDKKLETEGTEKVPDEPAPDAKDDTSNGQE